jgi:hypothetical protein
MLAYRRDMFRVSWSGFVPTWAGGECTDRTDVDAHVALVTFEIVTFVGNDSWDELRLLPHRLLRPATLDHVLPLRGRL